MKKKSAEAKKEIFEAKIEAFGQGEQRFISEVHEIAIGSIQDFDTEYFEDYSDVDIPAILTKSGGFDRFRKERNHRLSRIKKQAVRMKDCIQADNKAGYTKGFGQHHTEFIAHQRWSSAQAMLIEHQEASPEYRGTLDMPGEPILYEMGCDAHISFDRQFGTRMNSCHFEECCDIVGHKLYRLELVADNKKAWHLDEVTIMKWLGCDFKAANRLSVAWEKIGITYEMANKAVHGYLDDKRRWHRGIEGTGEDFIELYEKLAEGLSDIIESERLAHGITDRPIEADEVYVDGDCEEDQLTDFQYEVKLIFGDAQEQHHQDVVNELNSNYLDLDKLEEEYWRDQDPEVVELAFLKEDLSVNSNTFTSKELGRPEDSLNDRTIQYIKRCNRKQLSDLKKMAVVGKWEGDRKDDPRWTRDKLTGKKVKFDITYRLSQSAISDFWSRIREREAILAKRQKQRSLELINNADQISDQVFNTIVWFKDRVKSNPKQAKYGLTTQIYGGQFEMDGEKCRLITPKSEDEINLLWDLWNGTIKLN